VLRSTLAATIEAEIAWFQARLAYRFEAQAGTASDAPPPAPSLADTDDAYAALCREARLDEDARLVLILALTPGLRPQALDPLLTRNAAIDRAFTEFGGVPGVPGFRPTRETALFLLAGQDLARRLAAMGMFASDAPLVRHQLLARQSDEVAPWQPLDPHPELLARLVASTGG
jgi:hypothetical protein